jgi:hypothetical protein
VRYERPDTQANRFAAAVSCPRLIQGGNPWREVEDPLGVAPRKTARAAGLKSEALLKYVGSTTHEEIVKGLGKVARQAGVRPVSPGFTDVAALT